MPVAQLPSEVGRLHRLMELQFWVNRLTGSIPSQLGMLSNMYLLDMEDNPGLAGTIPTQLESIVNGTNGALEIFAVRGTSVTGVVPEGLCELRHCVFDCSDHLCGCECQCNATA